MSEKISRRLNHALLRIIGMDAERRKNEALPLVTCDDEGFPHAALLSPYQVVASDESTVATSVLKGTRTHRNLSLRKRATLIIPTPPSVYYIKLNLRSSSKIDILDGHDRTIFLWEIREILMDHSPDAHILSGIVFDDSAVRESYSLEFSAVSSFLGSL